MPDLYKPEFTVIDESDDWIVVDKPPHLMVHPSKPGNPPTLLDGLEQLLSFECATGGQISILTRLDRETSGLVLAAKHAEAASRLGKAMMAGEFTKRYQALVHGWPETDEFTIDQPIRRKGEVAESEIYIRQFVNPEGKEARTGFQVRERFTAGSGQFALLDCQLFTGRTHQIRVHLEHAGHPLVGDKIYGHSGWPYLEFIETGWTARLAEELLLDRHALHAAEIGWGELRWKAPLPEDLAAWMGTTDF